MTVAGREHTLALNNLAGFQRVSRPLSTRRTTDHHDDGHLWTDRSFSRWARKSERWARGDEPTLVGEDDSLQAVAQGELGEDVRDVSLDGPFKWELIYRHGRWRGLAASGSRL